MGKRYCPGLGLNQQPAAAKLYAIAKLVLHEVPLGIGIPIEPEFPEVTNPSKKAATLRSLPTPAAAVEQVRL